MIRLEEKIDGLKTSFDRLEEHCENTDKILNGNGRLGLTAKVAVVWSTYVWILCTMSAIAGCGATYAISHLLTKH